MGVTRSLAKLLLEEHRRKPVQGRGVILGRQTIFLTPTEAQALVVEVLGAVRPNVVPERDTHTHRGKHKGYISDVSFFALFTDAEIDVLDYSAYQGATIIQDLCAPLPENLKGRFDFVFNGSVLDNVLDPAAALDNVSDMLTDTGVSMHVEGSRHFSYAYIQFHPSWFFDYAVVNNYFDCKVFTCIHKDVTGPWDVYLWTPYHNKDGRALITEPFKHELDSAIVAIMEKQPGSTSRKRPVQANYRSEHRPYVDFFNRAMANQGRKLTLLPSDAPAGYYYVGTY